MLTFTRKLTESFIIGEDIIVKVIGKDERGNVRIGIEALNSVSVHREEIYIKLKEQSLER